MRTHQILILMKSVTAVFRMNPSTGESTEPTITGMAVKTPVAVLRTGQMVWLRGRVMMRLHGRVPPRMAGMVNSVSFIRLGTVMLRTPFTPVTPLPTVIVPPPIEAEQFSTTGTPGIPVAPGKQLPEGVQQTRPPTVIVFSGWPWARGVATAKRRRATIIKAISKDVFGVGCFLFCCVKI